MKLRDVFEPIEPPPGGLARLRTRLAPPRPKFRRAVVALAGSVAVAAIAAGVVRWSAGGGADFLAEVRELDATTEPVVLAPGQAAALERRPSSNPQVVLYRVAQLATPVKPSPEMPE